MRKKSIIKTKIVFDREKGYLVSGDDPADVCQVFNKLRPITIGGAFPYEICKGVLLTIPRHREIYYVLVIRFVETEEYDVRMYAPHRRLPVSSDISCYQSALEYVQDYKDELLKQGEKVLWSSEVTVYEDLPRPPVSGNSINGSNRTSIVNMALRSRVWTTPGK